MTPLRIGLAVLAGFTACGKAPQVDCTAISNVSTLHVAALNIAENVPGDAGFGGTLTDGTYVRTETRVYTGIGGEAGPSSETHRQTVVVSESGSVFKSADSKNGGDDEQLVFSVKSGGANLDATLACGKNGSIRYSYFTPSDTTLYLTDSTSSGGLTKIHTYVRQ